MMIDVQPVNQETVVTFSLNIVCLMPYHLMIVVRQYLTAWNKSS